MKKYFLFILFISFIIFNSVSSSSLLEKTILVDIKGAVNDPGVYEMKQGSSIKDLVIKSGGLKEYADTSMINMSKSLNDEDVIIIYTISEMIEMREGNTSVKIVDKECMCPKINPMGCINNNSKISLNTASIMELITIPGIGESKAKAIIEFRNKKVFTKIEDIMEVKGIGKGIFEKAKDYLTI